MVNELQLTVKIRTRYLGCGGPKEYNGDLGMSSAIDLLDPESEVYKLLKRIGSFRGFCVVLFLVERA